MFQPSKSSKVVRVSQPSTVCRRICRIERCGNLPETTIYSFDGWSLVDYTVYIYNKGYGGLFCWGTRSKSQAMAMANPQKSGGSMGKPSNSMADSSVSQVWTPHLVKSNGSTPVPSMGRCWDLAKLGIEIPEKPRIVLSLSWPLWNMTGT